VIGLKRYIRPGLVVSVGGHLAALIVGLLFVGANAFHAPPPEATLGPRNFNRARARSCDYQKERHRPCRGFQRVAMTKLSCISYFRPVNSPLW
jgi:hypothetical protein